MKSSSGTIDIGLDEFLKNLRPGDELEVYTDGSCIGNPGPGGWAGVFVFRDKRSHLSGFERQTTNNRMELKAAIEALRVVPGNITITLYTDSEYLKNGVTSWIINWQKNNWKSSSGKPVKNKDLWEELLIVINQRHINWNWVKGHGSCTNNNNADFIARSAIITSYMEE
jgi:ribonuclease HI